MKTQRKTKRLGVNVSFDWSTNNNETPSAVTIYMETKMYKLSQSELCLLLRRREM